MSDPRYEKLARNLLQTNAKEEEFEIELEDQTVVECLAKEFESMGFWVERHGIKPRINVVKDPYRAR